MTTTRDPDRIRRAIFAFCREHGIDADPRHAIAERATGKASLKGMDAREMHLVLQALKQTVEGPRKPRGRQRPDRAGEPKRREVLPRGPHRAKLRALWICGYELGIIRDRTDDALASWICANTDVDAAVWATPAMTAQCIEGLKDWLAREGGVDWSPYRHGGPGIHKPRCRILEAQWMKLHKGADHDPLDTLPDWVRLATGAETSYTALDAKALDELIRKLGERLRAARDDVDDGPSVA